MIFPQRLLEVWQKRIADDPSWWSHAYEAAVDRIEDHSDDPSNPYWESPANESSACPGPVILGFDGSEESPDELRARAFELLALADLAEIAEIPDER